MNDGLKTILLFGLDGFVSHIDQKSEDGRLHYREIFYSDNRKRIGFVVFGNQAFWSYLPDGKKLYHATYIEAVVTLIHMDLHNENRIWDDV